MLSPLCSLHIFSYSLSTSLLFSYRSVRLLSTVLCIALRMKLSFSFSWVFLSFISFDISLWACLCVCVSMSVCMHVASKCMCTSLDWLSGARERGNDITYNEEKQIKLYVEFNALDIAWLFLC